MRVHSGLVTDNVVLLSPAGTSFAVASDGHGGTKVMLDPPHQTAAVALLSEHAASTEHSVAATAGNPGHWGDVLFGM